MNEASRDYRFVDDSGVICPRTPTACARRDGAACGARSDHAACRDNFQDQAFDSDQWKDVGLHRNCGYAGV